MLNKSIFLSCLLTFASLGIVYGQNEDNSDIVQFSGVITFQDGDEILPLPGATISVNGTNRGTSTTFEGFFSLVVQRGEVLSIRFLGFKTEEITIRQEANTYENVILTMIPDAIDLPAITIYNIPSIEFFKQEFLAMEVVDPFGDRARENLSAGLMQDILETLPVDGTEVSRANLRQTAQAYYYEGQFRPQNIFNPLAWKKFIDSWRKGDFKKKDKK